MKQLRLQLFWEGNKYMTINMKKLNNVGRCQTAYRASMLDCEIPPGRHEYVLAICREPGRSQDALAAELCVNKSSVARVMDSFEAGGYVERRANPRDKRCLNIYPTEKLLSIYPKVKEITLRWKSLITDGIAESELEVFNSVLLSIEERAREIFKALSEDKK